MTARQPCPNAALAAFDHFPAASAGERERRWRHRLVRENDLQVHGIAADSPLISRGKVISRFIPTYRPSVLGSVRSSDAEQAAGVRLYRLEHNAVRAAE